MKHEIMMNTLDSEDMDCIKNLLVQGYREHAQKAKKIQALLSKMGYMVSNGVEYPTEDE